MRGRILDDGFGATEGLIVTDEGERYRFARSEWRGAEPPERGMAVDFEVDAGVARAVYQDPHTPPPVATKSRWVAGLLALLLGGFGVHKFYLGLNGPAIIMLMTNTVGLTVTAFLGFIPNYILLLVAFFEGLIYLTRSEADFEARYVRGRRAWF